MARPEINTTVHKTYKQIKVVDCNQILAAFYQLSFVTSICHRYMIVCQGESKVCDWLLFVLSI